MANVGEAVLAIVGDSKPFLRTLNNLDRTVGRSADRVGENIGDRIGNATGRALRIGLTAAATATAAVAGAALVKGFQRFADIEDATAALTITLGDAGKAAEFLGNVLEVVEGTPFSFDQFATVAKNLVALQVEAGKVPRILEAIGEAGAATGKGAEGVNTVADAIGRIATGAKLSLEPIRALEDQGIPALTILANKFGVTTSQMAKDITAGTVDSARAIDLLTDGILKGTTGVTGLSVEAEKARENLKGLGESAETADEHLADLRDNVEDARQRISDLARDAQDAKNALDDALRPASAREMESAILSVERSLNRQTDAAEELEDAQHDLNDALKETQRTADEIARGALDERRAKLSVEDAIDRVQEAEKRLKEARKKGDPEEVSDAERDLRSAKLSVEEAQLRLNDAEKDAEGIREDAPKQADKIAQAERRVRDAELAQQEAALGVIESQEDLNEVRHKGTEQDERVIDARRRVEDVTRRQIDAEKDLVKAQKEVVEAAEDVAEAHDKVRDAQAEVNRLLPETNKSTVALGGSMDALALTTRGAMGNLVTAVARAAAGVFTSFSKAGGDTKVLAKILINLRKTVDKLAPRFKAAADKIAGSDGFKKVLKFFENLSTNVDKALKDLKGKSFSEAFARIVEKIDFGSLASKVIDGFFAAIRKVPITKFSGVFTALVLETLATSTASIVEGFVRIAPKIALGVVAGLLKAFVDHPLKTGAFVLALGLPGIGAAITTFMSKLPFIGMVAPLFRGLGLAVSAGFTALSTSTLGTAVGVFALNVKDALVGALPTALQGAQKAVAAVASAVGTAIGAVVNAAMAAASAVVNAISTAISAALTAAGKAATAVATAVGTALGAALNVAIAVAQAAGRAVAALAVAIGTLLTTAAAAAAPVVATVGAALGTALDVAIGVGVVVGVPLLVAALGIALGILFNKLIEKFLPDLNRFIERISERITKWLEEELPSLFGGGVLDFLLEVGKKIVLGLLNGVIWAIRRIKPFGNIIADILQKEIQIAFEMKSPSRLTWRLGVKIGEGLTAGITDGIKADTSSVIKAASALVGSIPTPALSIRTPSIGELQALSNTALHPRDRFNIKGDDLGLGLKTSASAPTTQITFGDTIIQESETPEATARIFMNRVARAMTR